MTTCTMRARRRFSFDSGTKEFKIPPTNSVPMTTKAEKRVKLRELRKVCKTVRRCSGRLGCKVRVEWYPNETCPRANRKGSMRRAHIHSADTDHRGLICIAPAWIFGGRNLGMGKESYWTHPNNWPRLFAHEIAHLKTDRSHNSKEFRQIETRIYDKWLVKERFEKQILPTITFVIPKKGNTTSAPLK